MEVSWNVGGTPKSSILIGFSIDHPFWGTHMTMEPYIGENNIHPDMYMYIPSGNLT